MVRCLVEVVGGAGEKGALVMVLLAPDVAFHPPRPRHAHSVRERVSIHPCQQNLCVSLSLPPHLLSFFSLLPVLKFWCGVGWVGVQWRLLCKQMFRDGGGCCRAFRLGCAPSRITPTHR